MSLSLERVGPGRASFSCHMLQATTYQRRLCTCRRQTSQQTRMSLTQTLDTSITLAIGAGISFGIVQSSLPLLRRSRANDGTQEADIVDDDTEGIKWGAMSVIACIPLFNWLAWIFAAFDAPEKASQYYVYAVLYGLPVLRKGFDLDAFSILCVLACIAHVQVERIATSASTQDSPAPIPASQRSLPHESQQLIDEAIKDSREDADGGEAEQLRQWDEVFKKRSKQKDT